MGRTEQGMTTLNRKDSPGARAVEAECKAALAALPEAPRYNALVADNARLRAALKYCAHPEAKLPNVQCLARAALKGAQ